MENMDSLSVSVDGRVVPANDFILSVNSTTQHYYIELTLSDISLLGNDNQGFVIVKVVGVGQTAESVSGIQLGYFVPASSAGVVTPAKIVSSAQQVQIRVTGLTVFEDKNPVCVFSVKDVVVYSAPAILDIDYFCSIITGELGFASAKIKVNVLYDTPRYSIPHYPDVNNLFRPDYFAEPENDKNIIMMAAAPSLSEVQFSASGAGIVVYFNKDIVLVNATKFVESMGMVLEPLTASGELINCTDVLASDSSLGKFESVNGDCKIAQISTSSFEIQLSGEFSNNDPIAITVGNEIALLDNTVAAANEIYSETSSGRAVVRAPSEIPAPRLNILYPATTSGCADVKVDFSQSSTGISLSVYN